MSDAEKNRLETSDLVRKIVIENFRNSSRRKGRADYETHFDAKRTLPPPLPPPPPPPPPPHRYSDWTAASPKHSRPSTPRSTTTGTRRRSVVPSSEYSFSCRHHHHHQEHASAVRSPFGCYDRFHPDFRRVESGSDAAGSGYFGASASGRSINRSNCNAISQTPENGTVSRTSMTDNSIISSWKSSSRVSSVSDRVRCLGRPHHAAPGPGKNGHRADAVRPPGSRFESRPIASDPFGGHRVPGGYDQGLRPTASVLSTGPPRRRSVFDARMRQDSNGRGNTALRRMGGTPPHPSPKTKICETARVYPCYGQLVGGGGRAMGPPPELCPSAADVGGSVAAAWHRPNAHGEENAGSGGGGGGRLDLCSVDWDRHASPRLQNCYGDDDNDDDVVRDVVVDDDDDDDDESMRRASESIASLVDIRCESPECDGGSVGAQPGSSSRQLDGYCLTPEDPVSDGFCGKGGGGGGGGDTGSEEEDGDNWETEACCLWPDEWFPVAPSLQRAVARLALVSLRDGERVGQDLSLLKDANILPPDFVIPEEEEEDEEEEAGTTCGDSVDLESDGVVASPSLLRAVAGRLTERLRRSASSSSSRKTDAKARRTDDDDDPDATNCDKQLKGFAKRLRRAIRKISLNSMGSSTAKSPNFCSSSSSNSSYNNNNNNNNSATDRCSSMPVLSKEGLLLKCLAEWGTRTRSLRGTSGRRSKRRDPMSTGTGSSQSRGCGNQSPPGNEPVRPGDRRAPRRGSFKSEDTDAAAKKPDDSRRQKKKKSATKIRDDDARSSGNQSPTRGEKNDSKKRRHRRKHSKQDSKNSRSSEPQSERHNETESPKPRTSTRTQDRLERPEAGSRLSKRPHRSGNPRNLEKLVADVVRGLYSVVRGKLERLVDAESVETMSLALLRPRKADLEVHEFVLKTVVEHIAWLVRHHPRQGDGDGADNDDDLEGIVRTLAGQYVDTIITNAALKIDDGHEKGEV